MTSVLWIFTEKKYLNNLNNNSVTDFGINKRKKEQWFNYQERYGKLCKINPQRKYI